MNSLWNHTVIVCIRYQINRTCTFWNSLLDGCNFMSMIWRIPSVWLTNIFKRYYTGKGCNTAQANWHWLLTTEPCVQSQVTSCKIRGAWSGTGAAFLWVSSVFPSNCHWSAIPYSCIMALWDIWGEGDSTQYSAGYSVRNLSYVRFKVHRDRLCGLVVRVSGY
jgi:hypothetical protein